MTCVSKEASVRSNRQKKTRRPSQLLRLSLSFTSQRICLSTAGGSLAPLASEEMLGHLGENDAICFALLGVLVHRRLLVLHYLTNFADLDFESESGRFIM